MARRKRLTPLAAQPFAGAAPETKSAIAPAEGDGAPPVARVAGEAAQAAALAEIATAMTQAREGGRLVLEIELAAVEADYLLRDRVEVDPGAMSALRDSLLTSGQRTPVEVVALPGGRYGLISGWRRLSALRALHGEGRVPGTILAVLRRPADREEAYRAMVEENEIRADLSFYERARIVSKAVEQGVFETRKAGLAGLFGAVPRARRSKIKSFIPIVEALDGALRFPAALPEHLGLRLSQALRDDPALGDALHDALAAAPAPDAAAERATIEGLLAPAPAPLPARETRGAGDRPPRVETGQGGQVPGAGPGGPAVVISRDGLGRVRLDGPGVTPDFVARLQAWIAAGSP